MAKAELYVATSSGSCEIKDQTYFFTQGQTRVAHGHPLLKACPEYFKPDAGLGIIETATASPGEKREVTAPEPAVEASKPSGLTTASRAGK